MKVLTIPTDLFILLIIRMDAEMLATILKEDEVYMGMDAYEFEDFMAKIIQTEKQKGNDKLLALPGKIGPNKQIAYGFLGPKSKEGIGIVIWINDKKEIINITDDHEFQFDEFPFDIDKL